MIQFAKDMADFAASSGKRHVVVISSLDFRQWQNIDMSRYQSITLYGTIGFML